MATRRSREERESIKTFKSLMALPPGPLVIRCKRCSRLRETTEISDPLLALRGFVCIELGSSCEFEQSLGPTVHETEPHFVPGSFVIASKDGRCYVPGMIDFIPEKHPDYVDRMPCSLQGNRPADVYHVSLLNRPDQEFASGLYFTHELSPLDDANSGLMSSAEAREKHALCMSMERGDIRRRLYKFSYMAHKYGLPNPLGEPARASQIPITHGVFATPGPSTRDLYVNIIRESPADDRAHVTGLTTTYEGPPLGTPEAEQYLADLSSKTHCRIRILGSDDSSLSEQ